MNYHTEIEKDFKRALERFHPTDVSISRIGNVSLTITYVPLNRANKPVDVSAAVARALKSAKLPYYLYIVQRHVVKGTYTLSFVRKAGI